MIPILALLTADLVVEHANIYTGDPRRPKASSIAVSQGRVVALDDAAAQLGPRTKRIDARGATIVPGFIDSHGHMAGLGQLLESLDFRSARSIEEVARKVADAASMTPKGEWIVGRAWDQTRWPGGAFPTSDPLSKAAPDHPVYLTRVDGHAAWVNRKALEMADVNLATMDPAGGRIHRDASGKPTGVLVDRAMGLVSRKIPPPAADQVKRRLERAAAECARLGITSVHDAGVGEADLQAYHDLKLPIRVYAMIRGEGPLWDAYRKRGPEIGDRLTVRSIKLVADGAMGSRGAAFKEPYSDDPGNRGLVIQKREDIERVARAAVKSGFQVNTHAIGDLANKNTLDAYAAALGGPNDKRFRVEHAQIVSLEDLPLFNKFSIIASMQATHATSDMRWVEQRIGRERAHGAYAWQQLLKMGVVVANGSDFPVEEVNPLLGFYASVTRQDRDGSPAGGWMPEERMSRDEALKSWTWSGAYAAFEENDKGILAPGKLADFVILSNDIMTVAPADILKTRVTSTVVGGEIVYDETHTAIFNGTLQVARQRSRAIQFPLLERPATVVCSFQVSNGKPGVRAVLLADGELEQFREGKPTEYVAKTEFLTRGELRHRVTRPGEYTILLDNRDSHASPAAVEVNTWLEFGEYASFELRTLPPDARFRVVALSLLLFGVVAGASGKRLWSTWHEK